MKKTSIIILLLGLTGCSLLNPLIGYERSFKWHIDNYIDKSFDKMDAELKGRIWTILNTKTLDDEYNEYTFLRKWSPWSGEVECIWAAKINTKTNIFTSWRYISEPSQCDWPYFYEGAW